MGELSWVILVGELGGVNSVGLGKLSCVSWVGFGLSWVGWFGLVGGVALVHLS